LRNYADSSFIVRLLAGEASSERVITEYRRIGRPTIFFLPLHGLEVFNAILQRAFFQRHSQSHSERRRAGRDRDMALARLQAYMRRRALTEVSADSETVFLLARELSSKHTERIGSRTIDILHVANAIALQTDQFLTTDSRQAELAKAEGLHVIFVE
jgi:predicted nucleic acid-binding protein